MKYPKEGENPDSDRVVLRVDPKNRYINFYLNEVWIYDINLNDFKDAAKTLNWIRQMAQKTWATNQTISELCTLGLEGMENAQ
jgi:hypothetical protein